MFPSVEIVTSVVDGAGNDCTVSAVDVFGVPIADSTKIPKSGAVGLVESPCERNSVTTEAEAVSKPN